MTQDEKDREALKEPDYLALIAFAEEYGFDGEEQFADLEESWFAALAYARTPNHTGKARRRVSYVRSKLLVGVLERGSLEAPRSGACDEGGPMTQDEKDREAFLKWRPSRLRAGDVERAWHAALDYARTLRPMEEAPDQSEDSLLVRDVTAVVREADERFQMSGGSSRHWVRECFLPCLNKAGLYVFPMPKVGP